VLSFVQESRRNHIAVMEKLESFNQWKLQESQSLLSPQFTSGSSIHSITNSPSLEPVEKVCGILIELIKCFYQDIKCSFEFQVYCQVTHDGILHDFKVHPAVIARLEAQKSKRGICTEVLKQLHHDPSYFLHCTVTGKSTK